MIPADAPSRGHGENAPDLDKRKPVEFLNYPGDATSGFDPYRPMGPTALREALWPVSTAYDADADQTRVGFSYIAPAGMTRCRVCGCTDLTACEGGCSWVQPDLCSRCAIGGAL